MNKWIDRYVDEEGNVDDKLTLNSKGFMELTEDVEALVEKYTGVCNSGFMKCDDIRGNLMDLIHDIVNKKESELMTNYKDFTDDKEKMKDFKLLTKAEFLSSYSYLTEEEYDLTKKQEMNYENR